MHKYDHLTRVNLKEIHKSQFDIRDTVKYEDARKTINLALKFGSGNYFMFVQEVDGNKNWYMPTNQGDFFPDRKYSLIHKKYKKAIGHASKNGHLQYLWHGGLIPEWRDFAQPTSKHFISTSYDSNWGIRLLDDKGKVILTIDKS